MAHFWYKIFNSVEFEALGIPSKTYTVELEQIGTKDILVTKGIALGITYEGIFLSLNLLDQNPFYFEGMAIYKNSNNDVFLGFLDES
jgi:hypothetical protein